MTRLEMVLRMRKWLGLNATETSLDSDIQAALIQAQIELEQGPTLPQDLICVSQWTTTTAGEDRVEVPDTFIREVEDSALWYVDSAGVRHILGKEHLDDIRAYFASTEGAPQCYALLGKHFFLGPTPDGEYELEMKFYEKAAELTTDEASNVWSTKYSDLLMGRAGLNLCMDNQSAPEIEKRFSDLYNRALARLEINELAYGMKNFEALYGGG